MKIDLIVVSYKPDKDFLEMMQAVSEQTTPINKVIIYNVEQKFFDRITYSAKFASDYKNAEIHHISRREFDNGKTRNLAVKCSEADYFIVMAQNAIPAGKDLVENLIKAVEHNPEVAAAYARQIEREDNAEYAKYIMNFFFGEDSYVRSSTDIDTYGNSAFKLSNVCAIYKRDIFDKVGGFVNHAIYNEDVLFAATAMSEGYKIAYVPDAKVIYSYARTKEDAKKFFFDAAVSYAKHPEIFDMSEIMLQTKKIIKMTKAHLVKKGVSRSERREFDSLSRLMIRGLKQGKRYKSIPKKRILKLTGNPGYWSTDELMRDRSGVNARLGYGRSAEELNMLSKPPVVQNKDNNEER